MLSSSIDDEVDDSWDFCTQTPPRHCRKCSVNRGEWKKLFLDKKNKAKDKGYIISFNHSTTKFCKESLLSGDKMKQFHDK